MHRLTLPALGLWLLAGVPALASDLFWNVNPSDYAVSAHAPVHAAGYQAERVVQRQDRESADPRTFERSQPEGAAPSRREPAPRQYIDREPRREAEPAREYIDGPPPGEVVSAPEAPSHEPGQVVYPGEGISGDGCGHEGFASLDCAPLCGSMHGHCCDGDAGHCTDSIDRSLHARLKMAWWRIWHPHYWFRHPHADLAAHGCDHGHCGIEHCDHSDCGDYGCSSMGCDFGGCCMDGCFDGGDCHGGNVSHYGGLGYIYNEGMVGVQLSASGVVASYSTEAVRQPSSRQGQVSRSEGQRRYAHQGETEPASSQRPARSSASDSQPMMIEARPTGLDRGADADHDRVNLFRPLPNDVI